MKNSEKARELCKLYQVNRASLFQHLMAMAQWKDEQLDSAIDKALERNGEFLKAGKITQYGYDMAFATIQNIRAYLKQ